MILVTVNRFRLLKSEFPLPPPNDQNLLGQTSFIYDPFLVNHPNNDDVVLVIKFDAT